MTARRYAVVGQGRVGANVSAWLERLGHEVRRLGRADVDAEGAVEGADVVALAAPDAAIGELARRLSPRVGAARMIHFSGALLVGHALGYHPLYSFPKTILAPEIFAAIPFARQEGAPPLAQLVPGADNPEFVVADADRAFYHALAVLSGNFAAFLWNETAKSSATRLGLEPAALFAPFFRSLVERFVEQPTNSLTGPVARRDAATVEANLAALGGEERLASAYRAFLALAWPDFPKR